jgi:hypothetical protein
MSRVAMLSFSVATLVAFVGCEKKDTNVPGESTEEADFAPPEEEPEVEGVEEDEEEAPNLSKRSPFSA